MKKLMQLCGIFLSFVVLPSYASPASYTYSKDDIERIVQAEMISMQKAYEKRLENAYHEIAQLQDRLNVRDKKETEHLVRVAAGSFLMGAFTGVSVLVIMSCK